MNFGFVFFVIMLIASGAQARVFDITKESFAPYLRGTYSPVAWENKTFSESSGTDTELDARVPSNMSGEFGFLYATPILNFKFGIEFILPPKQKGKIGTNASSAELFTLDSETTVLIPKAALEFNLEKFRQTRFFLMVGAGMANLTSKNTYAMTATGTTDLGASDYQEELKASVLMYEASLGFESLLSDTTTWVFEAGYRMLNFKQLKHNKDVTVIGGTAVEKGDVALTNDGSDRSANLSGFYAGLSFRFFLF